MTLPTIDVSAAARAERVSTLDKNYVFGRWHIVLRAMDPSEDCCMNHDMLLPYESVYMMFALLVTRGCLCDSGSAVH